VIANGTRLKRESVSAATREAARARHGAPPAILASHARLHPGMVGGVAPKECWPLRFDFVGMSGVVTRPDPHSQVDARPCDTLDCNDLADARAASLIGDWDCVAALVERISPTTREQRIDVAFLRARAALHGELPDIALSALDHVAALLAADERATEATLGGTALAALGQIEEGTAILHEVARSASGRERVAAVYELANTHVRAGDLDSAEAVLAPLIDADAAKGCELLMAQALELYGRIELGRRRRQVAARHFLDALEVLACLPAPYSALEASLLHGLAVIAVDTLDLRLFARVRRELDLVRWPPGSAAMRASTQRLCLIGELLHGNELTAWTLAFETLRVAPAGSRYVAALLDTAMVSRAAGERFTPNQLLMTAVEVAQQVDWSGSDVRTLLAVVREAALVDAVAARELLAKYEPNRPSTDSSEEELHTLACLANAALAGTEGRRADQASALRKALELSRDSGNQYAEATALVAILAGDPDERLLDRAGELTRLAPRSWLRKRYEALAEHVRGPAQLSPAERRVMDAICEGRSTAEIADQFGRSKNTIRNQTRRVYEIMGVRTRSALVAKCAALALTVD
jgi:DNA-binding CsgD family transcriptional regulator